MQTDAVHRVVKKAFTEFVVCGSLLFFKTKQSAIMIMLTFRDIKKSLDHREFSHYVVGHPNRKNATQKSD